MPCYPVNMNIAGRCCVVIGGGTVAERKVMSLLAADALVTVISPQVTTRLAELAETRQIHHIDRPYQKGCLVGFFMAICATNDIGVNKQAAEEARLKGALVNVVDAPECGDFYVPAQIVRGDLLLTVSTGGKSPALARRLRQELSGIYGQEYGLYLDILAKVREELKSRVATTGERGKIWREALDGEVLSLLRQGKIKEAEAKIKNAVSGTGTES